MSSTSKSPDAGAAGPTDQPGADAPQRPRFSTPLAVTTPPPSAEKPAAKPAAKAAEQPAPDRRKLRQERQAEQRARMEGLDEESDEHDEMAERRRANRKRQQAIRGAARPIPSPAGPVRRPARPARIARRHIALTLSFLLAVVLPILVSGWYLYTRAADQYASYLGFSVRSESGGSTASDLLGGIGSIVGATNGSSTDTDVLYKFIQSHDLVQRVDAKLDLRQIWSKPENDPIFSYTGNATLEDLLSEWSRKVKIYYDTGMIDVQVLAFDPEDARAITQAIYDEGTILINDLNDVAREDALRYARDELERAQTRLREARTAVQAFRNRHQLIDPSADVQGQAGVVATLQAQLAEQLVSLGLLQANAQANDPRIAQAELRINVIRDQIADERQKMGSDTATGEALSDVVGQYEGLAVDRQFAEQSYTAALATYDSARAEAARQSRYLAAYVKPTLAQDAEFPQRGLLLLMMGGFLLTIWIVFVLIFYSLRDRR